ncbi:hypothetical protein C8039_00905 [Halogeometricum sp. wsp3]|nr:hypothetical protein C8039_00905 [Halogeometricum sp. wsp3]
MTVTNQTHSETRLSGCSWASSSQASCGRYTHRQYESLDLITAGGEVATVQPQAEDGSPWTVGVGGIVLGGIFGLKLVPEIIATAPLFGE